MALGPSLDIRQSQQLVMTQQLQQAIRLLALSNIEIEAVVEEELAKNPLLERGEGEGGEPDPDETPDPDRELAGADERMGDEGALDYDTAEAARDTDSLPDLPMAEAGEAFDFDRLEHKPASLKEHLLDQLAGTGGTTGAAAETIIHSLSDTGYLERSLAEMGDALGLEHLDMEAALALVQDLDPAGVGARSLSECLAIQARAADRYDPAMARLIDNLELLAKGRMKDLIRICGVDEDDLLDMVAELRAYDPKPGCRFTGTPATDILPDVIVERAAEGGWSVTLNPDALPRVLVNRAYHAELKEGASDKAARQWLADHLHEANWLVKALDQRAQTILKTAIEIVRVQEGFFRHGVAALKPLTLAQVAEKIEVHDSTVSRVTTQKYLLCDRGLFELKYFFGSGVGSADSEDGASALAVKAAIKALIDAEEKILSDDALVTELRKQGYDLARRTVAKYREAMGIGSSVQRRRQRKMEGGR